MTTEFTILEGEVFVDVKGFEERYKISNFGRRISINGKTKKPNISYGSNDSTGYKTCYLRKGHTRRIHALVAEHFLEKPNNIEVFHVNHKDGNKHNNHVSNLEWVTPAENCKHAVATGLNDIKGSKHPMSKLTEAQVLEMRRLFNTGNFTKTQISQLFDVCRRQASDVIRGVNWGWLNP